MPDSMIGRYLHARDQAAETGDETRAAEIDDKLHALGYRPGDPSSADRAEAKAEAEAKPVHRVGRAERAAD